MAAGHEGGLFQDPHFWVLLATVFFAAIAFRKGKKPVLDMLDQRTARIRTELEEAERLRNEAQQMLAEYQRKHRDALHTAQQILDNARETATRLKSETEADLDESFKRREAQLADRIKRAEIAAIAEIRNRAADIAMLATEQVLQEHLAKDGGKLIDKAVGELAGQID